ncbi:MAG TPA: ACT domain-containing protein [Methanocorpusculum sp.]|nr:ACT domain-containing protein [Methanocorpusculum sp.]
MRIEKLTPDFSVCRVKDFSGVDFTRDFVFTAKTDEEYSLVCPSDIVPENVVEQEGRWTCLRIEGVLDFSLVGILAKVSSVLAAEGISIFAVSTFNTDYILVRKEKADDACRALSNAGYELF